MLNISNDLLEITEVISNIATIAGVIIIIFGFFTFIIQKKNLNYTAVQHCVNEYKTKYKDLEVNDIQKIKDYISFVNEELFYFEKRYLPFSIADEWINGLIDVIPIYNTSGTFINEIKVLPNAVNEIMDDQMPSRIKKAFTVKENYNIHLIYSRNHTDSKESTRERKILIKEIKFNMGFHWWKRFI